MQSTDNSTSGANKPDDCTVASNKPSWNHSHSMLVGPYIKKTKASHSNRIPKGNLTSCL